MQGAERFADKALLTSLLERLDHSDHDVKERAFLALISVSQCQKAKDLLRAVKGLQHVHRARQWCQDLLGEADEDYREVLENLLVLSSDLEEMMGKSKSDRSEL